MRGEMSESAVCPHGKEMGNCQECEPASEEESSEKGTDAETEAEHHHELSRFSKEWLRASRKAAARQARESRHLYFERQREGDRISQEIERMIIEIQVLKEKIPEAAKLIQQHEAELAGLEKQHQENFLESFYANYIVPNFKSLRQERFKNQRQQYEERGAVIEKTFGQKQELKSRQEELEDLEEKMRTAVAQLEVIRADKSLLDKARQTVSDFYQKTDKDWNAYINEREARQVENLVETEECFFTHGTLVDESIPNNRSIKGIPWDVKIKVLCAIEPPVCTYATKQPGKGRSLWSDVGVFLRGGDSWTPGTDTAVDKVGERKVLMGQDTSFGEMLDYTRFQLREYGETGEIVVNSPKPAGIYVVTREGHSLIVDVEKTREMARNLGLPVYEIRDGRVFLDGGQKPDEKTKGLFFGSQEVHAKDILKHQGGVSEEKRQELLDELIATGVLPGSEEQAKAA